jgi:hypothetical protein
MIILMLLVCNMEWQRATVDNLLQEGTPLDEDARMALVSLSHGDDPADAAGEKSEKERQRDR